MAHIYPVKDTSHRRSSTGCLTCRLRRKVPGQSCRIEPGSHVCNDCKRLRVECIPFSGPVLASKYREAIKACKEEIRAAIACRNARSTTGGAGTQGTNANTDPNNECLGVYPEIYPHPADHIEESLFAASDR
ncbi:uncharacterized protein EI90DRAFT_3011548 [Cantharellus anzutake]|uniref:uncharacterized protein n=1 Tax=Cantharellus anzutake TaxID=1750568 RepID=UPI001903D4DB|nr:uncharacterized protein EI90DRAFT_3011548 [Cantharellus anzutake]KAF8343182.1 hypothetical protein EI90DRAFT_3011548 [Cantharellus anzutake]